MHPIDKYKKIAEELHAKAAHACSRSAQAELEDLAERYALLAKKTARTSWRYAKSDDP
jgi:hypothetical protein